MILYLDTSAHIKQYVKESGSELVAQMIGEAELVGCALIGQAEMIATMAKLVRMQLLTRRFALIKIEEIQSDWRRVVHLQITEATIARAGDLAWQHGLRGYDAVHLATALTWRQGLHLPITLATFDRQLWEAAKTEGLLLKPDDLAPFTRPNG
jgi:predicted nucleic acid-binding protein